MNPTDLRVVKTEQQIEQAFLALLAVKPYRAITVQDILDKALINRSTFYRHYLSKEALAEALVATFRQTYENFLTERFQVTNQENLTVFLNKFLKFIYTQKQRILSLWQIKTPHIDLYQDMYHLIKTQYIEHAKRQSRLGDLTYQGHMYASLVLTNLSFCLQENREMSIEQLRDELALLMATARIDD